MFAPHNASSPAIKKHRMTTLRLGDTATAPTTMNEYKEYKNSAYKGTVCPWGGPAVRLTHA